MIAMSATPAAACHGVALAVVLALTGCRGEGSTPPDPAVVEAPAPSSDKGSASDGQDVDAPDPAANDALRDELLAMNTRDQALQQRMHGEALSADERAALIEELREVQTTNRARFAELIEAHGWPEVQAVGPEAARAAVFLTLHATTENQRRYLPLARAAVERGQADGAAVAILEDRVRLANGEPQLYGTQVGCEDGEPTATNLDAPATVDERRAAVGLPPLAELLERMRPACTRR